MPSFVTMTGPGSAVISDDAALAIESQTVALTGAITEATVRIAGAPGVPGTLYTIEAQLSNINTTLTRIADQDKIIANQMSKLNASLGSLTAATSAGNAMQSMVAASVIQTNNFQVQATKDALQRADLPAPTMPPLEDQLKDAVSNGLLFNTVARAQGAISNFLSSTLTDIETWIKGTAVYTSISKYLEEVKDSILSIELPSSASAASRASSQAGVKDTWT
jgi:hypothetical protein